jgi:hypothetical protein
MRFAASGSLFALGFVAATAWAQAPSMTLTPASPSLPPNTPADVLMNVDATVPGPGPAPALGIAAATLGLVVGDTITSISFGTALPPPLAAGAQVYFSVDGVSVGLPFPPPPPNVSCEAVVGVPFQAAGDVYLSQPAGPPLGFANVLVRDGNGLADSICGPPALLGLGLLEPAPLDDLFSLDTCPATYAAPAGPLGPLATPVYFTLGVFSPTLAAIPATPSTILVAVPPGGLLPAIAFTPAALGLVAGDVIDAIDVGAGGAFSYVSLAPGSPSLGICGISAATVFAAPGPGCGWPFILPPGALGLGFGDNVDAVAVTADPDGDQVGIGCDNCPTVPNPGQENLDGDALGNACDVCETLSNSGLDADADGVDNACDTCTNLANAQIAGPPSANRSFISHQRDDDVDGRGNRCDFNYDNVGPTILAGDFNQMKPSVGKLMTASTCGLAPTNNQRCGEFDHDGLGPTVGAGDFNLSKAAIGKVENTSFPKCARCNLDPDGAGPEVPGWSNLLGSGGERVNRAVCQSALAAVCTYAP